MNQINASLLALLASVILTMLLAPLYIKCAMRVGAGQNTLKYVEQHKSKKGTPTMGGIVFILSTIIITIIFGGLDSNLALVMALILIGFGSIGLLDDLIKIVFKRNLGLRVYQKIIFLTTISLIAAWFCAKNRYIGTSVFVPIIRKYLDIGAFYIPFAAFVFLATTNAVNLTDGLDGLASSVNIIYLTTFMVIGMQLIEIAYNSGDILYEKEIRDLTIFIGALIGGIIGFLWFNSYKSQIIMGDTGALALGAVAGGIALFLKQPLLILTVGIMFFITALSVFIQVVSYKLRGKRVFLMSPLHHHLELKGFSESKITTFYSIITVIMSLVSLLII
ncbi:MAG: phospho-N-acetylmuramoyl-pentapeptide-transferase [Christensenellaceae bacterium]|jgi:phospho-N-acetylmuramoyl-pentapeptide-transferase|nr:phospho-N-acetylmuramoyl-pentapeptide-transferase [Christensenellaceae bacterium]